MESTNRLEHFHFLSLGSLLYALLYTFCLYRNASGITYPFFIGGTLFFFCLFLRKLQITVKRDSAFYIVSLMLLGISTVLTDDRNIHFLNKTAIFILMFVFMLHSLYQDDGWSLPKYVASFFQTIGGAFTCLTRPFSDLVLFVKDRGKDSEHKNSRGIYILFGLFFSIPLLFIIMILLTSADMIFELLVTNLLEQITLPENMVGICFTMIITSVSSYAILCFLEKKSIKEQTSDKNNGEPLLAITVTSLLSVVYLAFSGVQILYLFFGRMQLPAGYSYSEYARQGFFQLLFVCLLNLILVLSCISFFRKSNMLRIILTVISLCTYVMIFSSAFRMILYIKYYHLTFLRIFVLWSLVVISLLITAILIHLYRPSFSLFRFGLITVTVLYLLLSFGHPDYWIAKYNLNRAYRHSGTESPMSETVFDDTYYLSRLSADAAPVLLDAKNSSFFDFRDEYINRMQYVTEDMNPRRFNFSRFAALKMLPSPDVSSH